MTPVAETRRVTGVVHPCLTALPRPLALADVHLTDRAKVGVLLQAAGLLSLLERAGWRLAAGWEAARLSERGELAAEAEPGRAAGAAQDLLRDLAARLFRGEAVAGRGEARRAVRSLLGVWGQSLAPLPADEAVARLLDAAPFLWELDLAPARRALAGALVRRGEALAWVAGPRTFRRCLLARCVSLAGLWELLASPGARPLWDREEEGEPLELAASGRWRAAVAAWERRLPASDEERAGRAVALACLGRFESALEELAPLRSPAARALAARCQLDLGQLGAARVTLRGLEEAPLEPLQLAELAEVAARVHANRGEADRAGWWIRRALDETAGTGRAALRARLVAAGAAWDRLDFAAMDRLLRVAEAALDDPDLAWRWHQLRALHARGTGDSGAAVEQAARALRAGRRRLTRRQAAGLWNDLGLARACRDNLAGAERAFLHAARLEAGCDGPRKATLAFFNLAEIRIRRGRVQGVREIIARSEEENRRSGNLRGLSQDAGLWARFELALGRPAAALAVCQDALRELESQRHPWYREELRLFAARALGWLGRREEAAAQLAGVAADALLELEPEERPAVRALAGDREGAFATAAGSPFAALWERLLRGEPPPAPDWEPLARLEPYRAARLVYDAELLLPGAAPAFWRREAAATFRRSGAAPLAEVLESRDAGPWLVAAACLAVLRNAPAAREAAPPPPPPPPGGLIGESPELRLALGRLALLAAGDLPVLILGESGTGKELAARQLHRASARASGPFVAVNCAALSETLLLSDLFGHARGAFTGADKDRKGVFETAHGGTVFLDEIGDLPLAAQGLLLRVLQEGEIRRLGESDARRVNARVLAATHRDLFRMVGEGSFRGDLFYRLRVGTVELPPLRERGDDVSRIAEHILGRLRGPRTAWLSGEARELLLSYRWPGNVRELQNVLSVAATMAGFGRIDPEHLELPRNDHAAEASYHQQVDAFRRGLVAKALADHGGEHTSAARRLGVSRQTFSYLVRRFGLAGGSRRSDQPG